MTDDPEIEMSDEYGEHTNTYGRFCCPHCLTDNDIDEWWRSSAEGSPQAHTCKFCGKRFAWMWETTTQQITGYIKVDCPDCDGHGSIGADLARECGACKGFGFTEEGRDE